MENQSQQSNNLDNNNEIQEHDENNEEEDEGIINNQEYINGNQELNNNNNQNNNDGGSRVPPCIHRIPLFMNYRRDRFLDPIDDFAPRPLNMDGMIGDFPPIGRQCPRCLGPIVGSICPHCHLITDGHEQMVFIC